ncbi:hypothetical protein IGI04_012156, partial [Brassica rapa subsp. trilocularis]
HNGIAELLEILGSIINGFALPLKEEHKFFLVRALVPLHKANWASVYDRSQLEQSILSPTALLLYSSVCRERLILLLEGLVKYCPMMNSSKEVMFLGELEEVLEATQDVEFKLVWSLYSDNLLYASTVAERALFLCNNDHIRNHKVIMPIVLPALERNTRGHWTKLFRCLVKFQVEEEDKTEVKAKRKRTWKRSEDLADKAVMVPRLVSSVNLASIFESTG